MAKQTSALGARLRALRLERGLDIGTVAYRTGLDYNYIYRLERGDRRNPSYEAIRKIAQALSVPPEELLAGIAIVSAPVYPEIVELNRRLEALPALVRLQAVSLLAEFVALLDERLPLSDRMRVVLDYEARLTEAEHQELLDYAASLFARRQAAQSDSDAPIASGQK